MNQLQPANLLVAHSLINCFNASAYVDKPASSFFTDTLDAGFLG
jgi:hypothetical protein